MFSRGKNTTMILLVVLGLLIIVLGFVAYFNFYKTPEDFYKLIKLDTFSNNEEEFSSLISSKRNFEVDIAGQEFSAKIYKDNTMGIMIYREGIVAKNMENKLYLTGNFETTGMEDVDFAYEVKIGTNETPQFVVVRKNGEVYKINSEMLYEYGVVTFQKIEGLSKIVRIYQTGVITDNPEFTNANNVIAVDDTGTEYIITAYLMD